MLLLTSFAWHQVRNSEREPNCLKAIGSQSFLCCAKLYVLPILDLQHTVAWNKLLYHNLLSYLLLFCPWPWGPGSCVRAARVQKSLYHYQQLSIKQICRMNSKHSFQCDIKRHALRFLCKPDHLNVFFFVSFSSGGLDKMESILQGGGQAHLQAWPTNIKFDIILVAPCGDL